MRFCAAFGVPKKSGVARLFKVFATAVLTNFQDRLVMTASISLRVFFSPIASITRSTLVYYHKKSRLSSGRRRSLRFFCRFFDVSPRLPRQGSAFACCPILTFVHFALRQCVFGCIMTDFCTVFVCSAENFLIMPKFPISA